MTNQDVIGEAQRVAQEALRDDGGVYFNTAVYRGAIAQISALLAQLSTDDVTANVLDAVEGAGDAKIEEVDIERQVQNTTPKDAAKTTSSSKVKKGKAGSSPKGDGDSAEDRNNESG